jgi:hypothetical protein
MRLPDAYAHLEGVVDDGTVTVGINKEESLRNMQIREKSARNLDDELDGTTDGSPNTPSGFFGGEGEMSPTLPAAGSTFTESLITVQKNSPEHTWCKADYRQFLVRKGPEYAR